jgi:hypothetical protein
MVSALVALQPMPPQEAVFLNMYWHEKVAPGGAD